MTAAGVVLIGVPAAAGLAASACAVARRRAAARLEHLVRVCHELRGPLTAAGLAVHAAARRGELSERMAAALDLELRRAARALSDLEGTGARADRRELLDVHAAVARQMDLWREVASARGVELSHRALPGAAPVLGDDVRLAQAVGNLVANAIEHGSGAVEVMTETRDGRARIVVRDEGPGPEAALRAVRARAPRAGRGRRGRGLAITAGIAQRAGWTLAAEDAAGPRAGVALDLPLVPA